MQDDLKYWVAISQFPGFGAQKFKKLYSYFPDMQQAFDAFSSDLKEAGLDTKTIDKFLIARKKINPDAEWQKLIKEKVNVITILDKNYPEPLKQIYAPPAILYYKGKIENYNEYSLAVVGSRKISSYGKQVINEILPDIVKSQITLVSGMALGIDTCAHEVAIEQRQQTIAVLGSGLDHKNIYPPSNKLLLNKILNNNGIIISEFPIGMMPLRYNFPIRNRIISGLSKGTLVIEAAKSSGALITAKYALEQNREVFAVPGSIFYTNSIGTNELIKQGATVITSANEILESLNLTEINHFIENKKIIPESKEEESLLQHLNKEPIHIDNLVKLTALPASIINATLTLMEMKGKVKNLGNMNYVINR